MHIPAPKMPLPGHAESYRPPKEYLLTEEEQKQWEVNPVAVSLCSRWVKAAVGILCDHVCLVTEPWEQVVVISARECLSIA